LKYINTKSKEWLIVVEVNDEAIVPQEDLQTSGTPTDTSEKTNLESEKQPLVGVTIAEGNYF